MISGKASLQDCIDILKPKQTQSEYVVVELPQSKLHMLSSHFEYLGGDYYKCRRIDALSFDLSVISEWPVLL